jgi:general stress protein YciG
MVDEDSDKKRKRGFGSMSPERRREIASMGGKSTPSNFRNDPARASVIGQKGGSVSGGNFKNDPARAVEAGRKGGVARRLDDDKGK